LVVIGAVRATRLDKDQAYGYEGAREASQNLHGRLLLLFIVWITAQPELRSIAFRSHVVIFREKSPAQMRPKKSVNFAEQPL
jgi:hypothetical protein